MLSRAKNRSIFVSRQKQESLANTKVSKQHLYIHPCDRQTDGLSCRHCSECFTWPDQLKTHLLKSHNEGTWFTCNIFQKIFTRITNLRIHILCHEGVKPYLCSECSYHKLMLFLCFFLYLSLHRFKCDFNEIWLDCSTGASGLGFEVVRTSDL